MIFVFQFFVKPACNMTEYKMMMGKNIDINICRLYCCACELEEYRTHLACKSFTSRTCIGLWIGSNDLFNSKLPSYMLYNAET